jgi:hypothetical protein
MTAETPVDPRDYAYVAVESNTFWGMPDRPTLNYLARARLNGIHTIGLMCGAKSTDKSQRKLEEALRKTGASPIQTRSYWTKRLNDEKRLKEANRMVAQQMALQFATEACRVALQGRQLGSGPNKGIPIAI